MDIAILIPCYNEELTIKKVIQDFQKELPEAKIYVYDNNSTDNSYEVAKSCGVFILRENRQGKGNVVRSMFRDINADVYVMVDADDTYPAEFVHKLINCLIEEKVDMVVGDRHSKGDYEKENKRIFHSFGNRLVINLINKLFKSKLQDIMSGYRVFTNRFVKNLPVNSSGFEIETEISLHALNKHFSIREVPITYKDRPKGSFSKLNTYKDGLKVLKTIFWVFKDYKPLPFFCFLSLLFFTLGLIFGLPVIFEFVQTSYINKIPSAILSTGLMLMSILSIFSGFILDTLVKRHNESFEVFLKTYKGDFE